jgi:hypothetical protein
LFDDALGLRKLSRVIESGVASLRHNGEASQRGSPQ